MAAGRLYSISTLKYLLYKKKCVKLTQTSLRSWCQAYNFEQYVLVIEFNMLPGGISNSTALSIEGNAAKYVN